jgi:hypothetical protein
MDPKQMKALERAAYQRGYNQARRVAEKIQRRDRRDRFFCAALTGLINTPHTWTLRGDRVKGIDARVELARQFADKALEELGE